MLNKYLYIIIITTLLSGCVAPNLKGDLGVLSRKADAVQKMAGLSKAMMLRSYLG